MLFTIDALPFGKQRPRHAYNGGFHSTYTPQKTVDYEDVVKKSYMRDCGNFRFKEEIPLRLVVNAYFPIPKKTSKRDRGMMERGEIRPIKKPDWDNIGKIVSDALNGVAYKDDAQIIDGRVMKFYGAAPRVEVTITEIEAGGGAQ